MTTSEEQIRIAVAQQAGTWFIANQAGPLDLAERAAFMAWLKSSPIHVEEYLGVALIAHDLRAAANDPDVSIDALIEMARTDDTDGVVALEAPMPARESPELRVAIARPRAWSFATAFATVVLVTASILWLIHDGELLGLPKVYQTAHGEQRTSRLPDGTVLHLNTDSMVTVRYSPRERVIDVGRGQAMFQVMHDPDRRFRVAAGAAQIVAVGTQFDVYRQHDSTVVTVVDGSVAVFTAEPTEGAFPPDAQIVDAGYQLRVDPEAPSAQPIPVDLDHAVAWLQRKIAFERRPLGEVADEFNRYGPIPIEIDDDVLRALPISGVFDAYDTDSFAAFLETLEGVRVERTATRIRVLNLKATREEAEPTTS